MDEGTFKAGDIVWVQPSKRLGWWPGQVENVHNLRDDLKEDVTDKTIAVVKYFDEDNYQFVEEKNTICAYNSKVKEEYIALGMKKYFEKKRVNENSSTFMKFPNDVKRAEELTGGNPDITDMDKFQPKKTVAQSRYKDIFINPHSNKDTKNKTLKNTTTPTPPRSTGRTSCSPSKLSHPRFLGPSDHEVRIRRQSSPTGSPSTSGYTCDYCQFQTTRLNVIIQHRKTHTSEESSPKGGTKRSASPFKKTANKKKKTTEVVEDLFDQVKRQLEVQEEKPPKRKYTKKVSTEAKSTTTSPKTPKTPRTPKSPSKATSKGASKSQLCPPKKKWLNSSQKEMNPEVKIKLMADWDEDEEDTTPKEPVPKEADSDGEFASKSQVLQHRSDNEDDEDVEMEKKVEKSIDGECDDRPGSATEEVNHNADEPKDHYESLANISAEIEKLNAEMQQRDRTSPAAEESFAEKSCAETVDPNCQIEPVAEVVHVNGAFESVANEDSIRDEVASLLAETSVPILPEELKDFNQTTTLEDNSQNEVAETNENILMQVEGGETYMVVWEPGSNIQDLLAAEGGQEAQTLIIDPSSLQPDNNELENLFQIAVQTDSKIGDLNEQSNQTKASADESRAKCLSNASKKKGKTLSESLILKYGSALGREIKVEDVVWAKVNGCLFSPVAVSEMKGNQVTTVSFDVYKPNNKRRFHRNRLISLFNDQVNRELLEFSRKRNRVSDFTELNRAYDYAHQFHELRQTKHPELTVRQYLICCFKSPVKLFSDRYLKSNPEDEIADLIPSQLDDAEPVEETDAADDLTLKHKILEEMIQQYVLTDVCLDHLKAFVTVPSERLRLYHQQSWKQLSMESTVGIFEKSKKLYCMLADFLTENVTRVKDLVEGKDHKRAFILNVLLPEALSYGVQKKFKVKPEEASRLVIYGIKMKRSQLQKL